MSSEDNRETTLEIFREDEEGRNVLSRFCVNVNTKEVVYYCEVDSERISIHRGDATGPVIATADSFQGKNGITEVQLTEVSAVVPIRHKHHSLPFMHGHTFFKVEGKQYQWKRHDELVEQGNKVILAKFHASHEKDSRKLGSLIITPEGQVIANLAVITYLIDHERSDEGKWKKSEVVSKT